MLSSSVYIEAHPRRTAARANSSISKSFNFFAFNSFRTLFRNGAHATLFLSIDSALFLLQWGVYPPLFLTLPPRVRSTNGQIALFLAPPAQSVSEGSRREGCALTSLLPTRFPRAESRGARFMRGGVVAWSLLTRIREWRDELAPTKPRAPASESGLYMEEKGRCTPLRQAGAALQRRRLRSYSRNHGSLRDRYRDIRTGRPASYRTVRVTPPNTHSVRWECP